VRPGLSRSRRRRRVGPLHRRLGEDGALDAIREYAQTIDTIARRIEDALDRGPGTPPAGDAVAVEQLAG